MSFYRNIKRVAGFGTLFGGGIFVTSYFINEQTTAWAAERGNKFNGSVVRRPLPSRAEQLESLQKDSFDILVIGGGATGVGCALDATTRGLKTALVELEDFSSGTSSRSTKLIHGGVRYLQNAIIKLDIEQYKMVKEALYERANFIQSAPHLATSLPIMLPIYKWYLLPYYWVGIKAYDFVAGKKLLKPSYYLSKKKALEQFPMLKDRNLCGALVYYDGQQDDSRMNVSLAITATKLGATISNHVKVLELIKEGGIGKIQKIVGAKVRDELSGLEFNVRAKCVINATGPFTDSIRNLDDPNAASICAPSSGVHITLPAHFSPKSMGLLDPETSDGRVIFLLPWQNLTIAGTTDTKCEVTRTPSPSEKDINFLLKEVQKQLHPKLEVRRSDALSAWCGIRPLVCDPSKTDTKSLVRNHMVHVSSSGLVTIAGGKWTTFRAMAEEAVDAAVKSSSLNPSSPSQTSGILVEGAVGWHPQLQNSLEYEHKLEPEVAAHLSSTYGDQAVVVLELAKNKTGTKRLHPNFPYIEAEVRYAIKEYAATAIDVIARRTRLAFLNVRAAEETLDSVIDIMADELKWSKAEKKRQKERAMEFLNVEMGLGDLIQDEAVTTKTKPDSLEKTNKLLTLDQLTEPTAA